MGYEDLDESYFEDEKIITWDPKLPDPKLDTSGLGTPPYTGPGTIYIPSHTLQTLGGMIGS